MAPETRRDAILGLMDAGVGSAPTVDVAVGLHSECRACGTYTGAYDVAALQARVALLEGLLREVEWIPEWYCGGTVWPSRCALCDGRRHLGHAPDCRLVAALADGG